MVLAVCLVLGGLVPATGHALDGDELRPVRPVGWTSDETTGSSTSSLALSLAWAKKQDRRNELAGSLVLTLPTAGWLASPSELPHRDRTPPAARADGPRPDGASKPSAGADDGLDEPCPEEGGDGAAHAAPARASARDPEPAPLPSLRSQDVRAALRAARRGAQLARWRERLDDLAGRARWSAALPRVRLRVTRLIDESASLSPTSYDAERQTASGGASLWLEARTTWRLDRALFASEEIRLERLRYATARQRERIEQRALELLLAWQQAAMELLDSHRELPFAECRSLWLRERQLALELDVATAGWFERWRRRQTGGRPRAECTR